MGPRKVLISNLIGQRGALNPEGWNAIGRAVTPMDFRWGPRGTDEPAPMTWTPPPLSRVSTPSLAYWQFGMRGGCSL